MFWILKGYYINRDYGIFNIAGIANCSFGSIKSNDNSIKSSDNSIKSNCSHSPSSINRDSKQKLRHHVMMMNVTELKRIYKNKKNEPNMNKIG